ncbi:hypothetical protein OIO90_000496 [Microbotryomycetes sp. JL221]|nr:hypothetical protein OIO90_000496 [Microbotryomycetes sp. JL221]
MSSLTLEPIRRSDLPQSREDPQYQTWVDATVQHALDVIASLVNLDDKVWSTGKVYNKSECPTQAYSSKSFPPPGTDTSPFKWHARVSRHATESYDRFKQGLLIDHTPHEKQYIEALKHVEKLGETAAGEVEVWRTCWPVLSSSSPSSDDTDEMPFPTSNRDFTFAICTKEIKSDIGSRAFLVVSMPFDHPKQQGYMRAKYVSVEHVREDNGEVVWIMATASDAGGLVPRPVSDLAMPSKIAEDVPGFLRWLGSQLK